jgi:hypothetical protein
MKNVNLPGLFDDHFLMDKLTKLGDPLQRLNKYIDWEVFRGSLDGAFETEPKGKGGRPPFDKLMMFKALVVQGLYNLSDDQLEYQIVDRSSFKRFFGLKKADTKTKLIEEYSVTDASVHDSQAIEGLLTEKDEGQPLYADSAYTGEKQEETYKKKKVVNMVHEKGYCNTPLRMNKKPATKKNRSVAN